MEASMTQAQMILALTPHSSERAHIASVIRHSYKDTGFTETWTFADASVLRREHAANPGYQWSAD